MGLDMYLFKVKKLTDRQLTEIYKPGVRSKTLEKKGYRIFFSSEEEPDYPLTRHLKENGFLYRANVISEELDMDRLCKDNGIPEEAYQTGYAHLSEVTIFSFSWKTSNGEVVRKEIDLSPKKLKEYIVPTSRDVFICRMQKARYWKKWWELSNYINERYPEEIKNCGFYPLDEDDLEDIFEFISREEGTTRKPPKYNAEREMIMYQEWH